MNRSLVSSPESAAEVPEPEVELAEPEVQPEVESAAEGPAFAENEAVDWTQAEEDWGLAWPLHIYLSATLYCLISLWALIYFFRVLATRGLPGKAFPLALNGVMLACAPGRAVNLLTDPYGTTGRLNLLQQRLTIAPFFPSITAAFILVFAMLLRLTRLRVVPTKLFSPRMVAGVVLVNYVIGMTTDLLGSFYGELAVLLLFCEGYFTLWGLVAGSGYMYVFWRLYQGVVINRRKLNALTESEAVAVPSKDTVAMKDVNKSNGANENKGFTDNEDSKTRSDLSTNDKIVNNGRDAEKGKSTDNFANSNKGDDVKTTTKANNPTNGHAMKKAEDKTKKVTKVTENSNSGKGGNTSKGQLSQQQRLDTRMPLAAKITLAAATSFVSISILHVWRIAADLTGLARIGAHAQWLAVNSLMNISEVVMGATVLYVGALPFRGRKKK